jgi:hypothetical protein
MAARRTAPRGSSRAVCREAVPSLNYRWRAPASAQSLLVARLRVLLHPAQELLCPPGDFFEGTGGRGQGLHSTYCSETLKCVVAGDMPGLWFRLPELPPVVAVEGEDQVRSLQALAHFLVRKVEDGRSQRKQQFVVSPLPLRQPGSRLLTDLAVLRLDIPCFRGVVLPR